MTLRLEIDGAVARLLIDRPEKRNAVTQAMWDAFPALIAEAVASPARAILLASATPGMFSAGADIGEFAAGARDPDWRAANQAAINRTQQDLARADKPTVAFIDGDCVGGGCGLALACDLRVATARARFGITPAKLGLVYPLHDTKLLVDQVGPAKAKRLLYTGVLIGAEEALAIGLIDAIAASPDDRIAQIVAQSGHSQRQTKAMVRRILDGQAEDDDATRAMFAGAFDGDDFAEGVSAFLEKRKAQFR
ncbi:Enoyl-CoA hydratase [Sphingomonas antarctica]|uniref:enoyl-CoA hydratase/isomerase family protein n=1 Tax=Sphingomonas antarctica TaxID=2040274 RepID=UPI0039E7414E